MINLLSSRFRPAERFPAGRKPVSEEGKNLMRMSVNSDAHEIFFISEINYFMSHIKFFMSELIFPYIIYFLESSHTKLALPLTSVGVMTMLLPVLLHVVSLVPALLYLLQV